MSAPPDIVKTELIDLSMDEDIADSNEDQNNRDEKTYKRKSAAIACKRFPGTHSHEAIETRSAYNLTPERIDAAVTGNESNFVKEFKEHGLHALDRLFSAERSFNVGDNRSAMMHIVEDFSLDDSASEDAHFSKQCQRLPQHLRCASYTLHDIANTDIIRAIERSDDLKKTHSRVLAKCKSAWESLQSPNIKESLRNYLNTALLEAMLTRWKSHFDALQQLVTLKRKLLMCRSANAHTITLIEAFTDSDFGYVEEYITSTKPLAKAIDQLQNETYCYYGYLLPTLVFLRSELLLLRDKPEMTICKPLVAGMIEALETRFKNMFEISDEGIAAAIAAVSHPKFKISWLSYLSAGAQKLVYDHVIDAVAARMRSNVPSDPKVVASGDGFNFGGERSIFKDLVTHNATVNAQLTQYLNDPDKRLDMLKNHPVMERIFCEFNSPLLSSAPVQRLFSDATMTDLPKFNTLSDRHFEERVVAAANVSKYYL